MQANNIRFGKEYAVYYQGKLHALRVLEMINVRTRENASTNYVMGELTTAKGEGGLLPRVKFKVGDVLEEIETYRELVEEKARQKLAADALIAARIAKRELAAKLLARAIGVHVILETRAGNYHEMMQQPHVKATGYSSIDIDERAFDALTTYLKAQGVYLDPIEDEVELGAQG